MSGYGRSWRNLQRQLSPDAPSVATLNGWRRFSRPVGLAAVAAVAGAGLAVFLSNRDDGPATTAAVAQKSVLSGDARTVQVRVTDAGCTTDRASYPSGTLLFTVNNVNANGLGTVALLQNGYRIGERDNVVPGSTGSFVTKVQPGRYTLACPGTSGDQTSLTVTGQRLAGGGPDVTTMLEVAGRQYTAYVTSQAGEVVNYLGKLITLANNGRLLLSECAYAHARQHLDFISEAAGVSKIGGDDLQSGWTELAHQLFQKRTTAGVASMASNLLATAKNMRAQAPNLTFASANVSQAALDEITSISQDQLRGPLEPYSSGDILDIQSMIDGSRAAVNLLRPALMQVDATFVANLDSQYVAFNQALKKYHNGSEPFGYVGFDTLANSSKKSIAEAVRAIMDPVSGIPAKLVRQ